MTPVDGDALRAELMKDREETHPLLDEYDRGFNAGVKWAIKKLDRARNAAKRQRADDGGTK